MSKVISIYNKGIDDYFLNIKKNNRNINVWCNKDIKAKITKKEFAYIVNFSIKKLLVLKSDIVGFIFVHTKNDVYLVGFCVDEENTLNIDSIEFYNRY